MDQSPGFDLYLITSGLSHKEERGGEALKSALEKALEGGVRAVQLREKGLGGRAMLETAKEMRAVTRSFGARLLINDRLDIALLSGADGVHLTSNGLDPARVRKYLATLKGWQRGLLIGVSTHSLEEAEEAEYGGADFVTFGPVYATPSKAAYGPPVGIEKLAEVGSKLDIPVFALGGVTAERVAEVIENKASGVAVISYILAADDIKEKASSLVKAVKTAAGSKG